MNASTPNPSPQQPPQRTKRTNSTKQRRRAIPKEERLKLWVRSGGMCCLCKTNLMVGNLTAQEMTLGEAAHIVGQSTDASSPRGQDSLPKQERDKAENLLLACGTCHDEIDNKLGLGLMTIEKLKDIKREHESLLDHLHAMPTHQRTVVVRMLGQVRGQQVELHRNTAAAAVLRSGNRFPDFPLSYDGQGVEIDLRPVAGEAEGTPEYFSAGKALIDEAIRLRLSDGIVQGRVQHLSVFGFARLPLLVYLGSQLDDTIPTDLYQRHRLDDRPWEWQTSGEVVQFRWSQVRPGSAYDEAVLVANVSGTIQLGELPGELNSLPLFQLEPTAGIPSTDMLCRRESLANFMSEIRGLFSWLEQNAKEIRKLHVLGALPITAGLALGRAHDAHVHPVLVIYDRSASSYQPVLEI